MPTRRTRRAIGVAIIVVFAFIFAQVRIGITSIRLDLKWIGESIYQAHATGGQWPKTLDDLNGTNITVLVPRLKPMIADGRYIVHWHADIKPEAKDNADRILAYENHSLFSRLGYTWVCFGDLRVESMTVRELQRSLPQPE